MNEQKNIVPLPQTENGAAYMKRTEEFLTTCERISFAWEHAGFTGDPIINLFSSAWGMYVHSPKNKKRRG